MNKKIDFVILWVDGNDPKWQAEKNKYTPSWQQDTRAQRYREWDNLKYWFRGVEKFAPWVNNIYFVTWGHLPKWLNTSHPQLKIVNHEDFMPVQYLPTFNCNPLELNFHRIQGLEEQFVYFNDDTFIISPLRETDCFKKGKPCDSAALNVHCIEMNYGFNYANMQATGIINKYFDFHKSLMMNWKKWFNLKNGKELLRTLYLLPCPRFPGVYQPHLPNSYLKSTYKLLWEKEYELFNETCLHKFRDKLDYTQWTIRNWQLASGNFEIRSNKIGKSFYIEKNRDSMEEAIDYLLKQKGSFIAINDGEMSDNEFILYKEQLIDAFDKILPQKSSYEM